MAFAPKGSRPKPDDAKRNASKTLEDNRMPAIIAAPIAPRERVIRKPPLPRGIVRTNPPMKQDGVPSSTSSRTNIVIKRKPELVARPKTGPSPVARVQPKPVRTTSKPALPPKPQSKQTQVAPDALTISGQLVPWIYMRSSLEGTLEQLEKETEDLLKVERERLLEAQKLVEESQLRQELKGQAELLEDLCEKQNLDFSISLAAITKDILSFVEEAEKSDTCLNLNVALEMLQDKVYSNEQESEHLQKLDDDICIAIQQGQAIKHRLDGIKVPHPSSQEHPSRWKLVLKRFNSLLESRIRNLQVLRGAVTSVVGYQKRRMELQFVNIAIS